VPHHGPLWVSEGISARDLADPAKPCSDAALGSKAFSGRWTGMDPSSEFSAFRGMLYAQDIDEAKQAWLNFKVGAQNLVVGDNKGGVLYFPYARVPMRDGDLAANPPWLPLPGEGGYEWLGDVPADELPQKEITQGYLVTANNDIAGVTEDGNPVNDKHYLFRTRDLGLRAGRITRLLKAASALGPLDLDTMRSIQSDTVSDFAAGFVPALLAAADARADLVTSLNLAAPLARLRAWNFEQPTGLEEFRADAPPSNNPKERDDAIATSIFAAFLYHAIEGTFRDELDAAGIKVAQRFARPDQSLQKALYFALTEHKEVYFDDLATPNTVETREETLLGALAGAVTELGAKLGTDDTKWLWGRLHQVELQSIFGVFGVPNDFGIGPVPQPGGFHTINVANFDRDYLTTAGPSVRMLTDVIAEGPASEQIIPGGVIDQLGNPNRDDQLLPWLRGEYKVIVNEQEQVKAAAIARDAQGGSPGGRWLFTAPTR